MSVELTAKQENFCQHFLLHRSPDDAYRYAYDVRPDTGDESVRVAASKLFRDPKIALRLKELKDAATVGAAKPLAAIIDEIDQMAEVDYNELSSEGVGSCRHCWSVGHGYHWKEREYFEALGEAERQALKDPTVTLPDCSGGFGYWLRKAPNENCPTCEGAGVSYVRHIDTAKLSPAARMVYQGVKITRHGRETLFISKEKLKDMQVRLRGGFKDGVDLKLTGALGNIDFTGKTPQEAAQIYATMLAGPKK